MAKFKQETFNCSSSIVNDAKSQRSGTIPSSNYNLYSQQDSGLSLGNDSSIITSNSFSKLEI